MYATRVLHPAILLLGLVCAGGFYCHVVAGVTTQRFYAAAAQTSAPTFSAVAVLLLALHFSRPVAKMIQSSRLGSTGAGLRMSWILLCIHLQSVTADTANFTNHSEFTDSQAPADMFPLVAPAKEHKGLDTAEILIILFTTGIPFLLLTCGFSWCCLDRDGEQRRIKVQKTMQMISRVRGGRERKSLASTYLQSPPAKSGNWLRNVFKRQQPEPSQEATVKTAEASPAIVIKVYEGEGNARTMQVFTIAQDGEATVASTRKPEHSPYPVHSSAARLHALVSTPVKNGREPAAVHASWPPPSTPIPDEEPANPLILSADHVLMNADMQSNPALHSAPASGSKTITPLRVIPEIKAGSPSTGRLVRTTSAGRVVTPVKQLRVIPSEPVRCTSPATGPTPKRYLKTHSIDCESQTSLSSRPSGSASLSRSRSLVRADPTLTPVPAPVLNGIDEEEGVSSQYRPQVTGGSVVRSSTQSLRAGQANASALRHSISRKRLGFSTDEVESDGERSPTELAKPPAVGVQAPAPRVGRSDSAGRSHVARSLSSHMKEVADAPLDPSMLSQLPMRPSDIVSAWLTTHVEGPKGSSEKSKSTSSRHGKKGKDVRELRSSASSSVVRRSQADNLGKKPAERGVTKAATKSQHKHAPETTRDADSSSGSEDMDSVVPLPGSKSFKKGRAATTRQSTAERHSDQKRGGRGEPTERIEDQLKDEKGLRASVMSRWLGSRGKKELLHLSSDSTTTGSTFRRSDESRAGVQKAADAAGQVDVKVTQEVTATLVQENSQKPAVDLVVVSAADFIREGGKVVVESPTYDIRTNPLASTSSNATSSKPSEASPKSLRRAVFGAMQPAPTTDVPDTDVQSSRVSLLALVGSALGENGKPGAVESHQLRTVDVDTGGSFESAPAVHIGDSSASAGLVKSGTATAETRDARPPLRSNSQSNILAMLAGSPAGSLSSHRQDASQNKSLDSPISSRKAITPNGGVMPTAGSRASSPAPALRVSLDRSHGSVNQSPTSRRSTPKKQSAAALTETSSSSNDENSPPEMQPHVLPESSAMKPGQKAASPSGAAAQVTAQPVS